MRSQAVFFGALFVTSLIAVPYFYNHRMSAVDWSVGMIAFVGVPFLIGILQKQPNQSLTVAAATLVLICPVVYAITDRLEVQFEKLRDGWFLAAGATTIFVSAAWLAHAVRCRMKTALVGAVVGLILATAEICILLWLVIYLE